MSLFYEKREGYTQPIVKGWNVGFAVILGILLVIGVSMAFYPIYRVWSAGQRGKAELQHADFERQVQVVNAQANLQAQKFNAEAEVARAGGVAQANALIKDSLTELYVKYLWVATLDRTGNQIIYVPLGPDGLPVTEAGRAVK
jgi:hypothetical protein